MFLKTKCGKLIEVNKLFWAHVERHPGINVSLLTKAMSRVEFKGREYSEYMHFDRIIGMQGLIYNPTPVKLDEVIWFGVRKNRLAPTPVAKNSYGIETQYLYFSIRQVGSCYCLINAYPADSPDSVKCGQEPISKSLAKGQYNAKTSSGVLKKRQDDALNRWRHFSIAEHTTDFEFPIFQSNWNIVIERYSGVYDS